MNFNDLYKKIQAIDEGTTVNECGEMPHQAPPQQDTVTMNVSMNGSGAGGIKDLMNILKNIEQGGADTDMVIGDSFEDATTRPNEVTLDIDSVIPTGNDIHSKGGEAEKVNGGGNPMRNDVDESLVSRLSAMLEEVKAKKEKEPEGTYSKKRFETDGQRVARLAREKRQAANKERMRNDFNAEMERE